MRLARSTLAVLALAALAVPNGALAAVRIQVDAPSSVRAGQAVSVRVRTPAKPAARVLLYAGRTCRATYRAAWQLGYAIADGRARTRRYRVTIPADALHQGARQRFCVMRYKAASKRVLATDSARFTFRRG